MYLFHPLVTHLLFIKSLGATASPEMGLRGFLLSCAAFALVLLVSAVSFFVVEKRLISIGHRYRYRSGAAAFSE